MPSQSAESMSPHLYELAFLLLPLFSSDTAPALVCNAIYLSLAMLFDPIVGNGVTLFGTFMGRWANYLFIAAGGLLVLAGVLLESFAIWPLLKPVGSLRELSVALLEAELSRFMKLTIMIASPVMVVIFIIDRSIHKPCVPYCGYRVSCSSDPEYTWKH